MTAQTGNSTGFSKRGGVDRPFFHARDRMRCDPPSLNSDLAQPPVHAGGWTKNRKRQGISMKRGLRWLLALVVAGTALWINNSPALIRVPEGKQPRLISHRGVHQTYPRAGLTPETCTAARVRPVSHGYIENTLPSMRMAFR